MSEEIQKRLEEIRFRIGRGSHFEKATLPYSGYAIKAIDEDMPWLVATVDVQDKVIASLSAALQAAEADADRLAEAIDGLDGDLQGIGDRSWERLMDAVAAHDTRKEPEQTTKGGEE